MKVTEFWRRKGVVVDPCISDAIDRRENAFPAAVADVEDMAIEDVLKKYIACDPEFNYADIVQQNRGCKVTLYLVWQRFLGALTNIFHFHCMDEDFLFLRKTMEDPCVACEIFLKAWGPKDESSDLEGKDGDIGTRYQSAHISAEKAVELKSGSATWDDLSADELRANKVKVGIPAPHIKNSLSCGVNLTFPMSMGRLGLPLWFMRPQTAQGNGNKLPNTTAQNKSGLRGASLPRNCPGDKHLGNDGHNGDNSSGDKPSGGDSDNHDWIYPGLGLGLTVGLYTVLRIRRSSRLSMDRGRTTLRGILWIKSTF